MSSTTSSENRVASRILHGLQVKFKNEDVSRVITTFERFLKGKAYDLDRFLCDQNDAHNRQQATCWVDGIKPIPFHDITQNSQFQWGLELEKRSEEIIDELSIYLSRTSTKNSNNNSNNNNNNNNSNNNNNNNNDNDNDRSTATSPDIPQENQWLGSRNQGAGEAYGPQWQTLGLMDRGLWDYDNTKHFPQTVKLIKELNIPACEVFFARQEGLSGIKPHSDQNNFILTCHLGLQVEENKAWIKVGNETKYWKKGGVMIFDTSIFHSTYNHAETPRYVLLIRLWHPDLTSSEIKGFRFVFDFLNFASYDDSILNAFEAYEVYGIGSGVQQLLDPTIGISEGSFSDSSEEEKGKNKLLEEKEEAGGLTRQQRREKARREEKQKTVSNSKGSNSMNTNTISKVSSRSLKGFKA